MWVRGGVDPALHDRVWTPRRHVTVLACALDQIDEFFFFQKFSFLERFFLKFSSKVNCELIHQLLKELL